MPGPVLLTAIGFKPELVREPARQVGAVGVYGIATKHPKVTATRKLLEEWGESAGIPLEVVTVRTAFDFVEWYHAWNKAKSSVSADSATVNLTAGHAVAISTAAIMAMRSNIPCVCYDDLEDELHHLSPSILLRLDDLIARDRAVLQLLANGPRGVGDIVAQTKDKPSTISRTLLRLQESGFLTVEQDVADNRRRVAALRPGVRAFLGSVLDS